MPDKAIRLSQFMRLAVALGGAAALAACGPAGEFTPPPQPGAWNRGIYPSFSQKPQAEAAQFSAADEARLKGQLQSAGKRVSAEGAAEDQMAAQPGQRAPASAQQQADKEMQDTLRQIQGGGK